MDKKMVVFANDFDYRTTISSIEMHMPKNADEEIEAHIVKKSDGTYTVSIWEW